METEARKAIRCLEDIKEYEATIESLSKELNHLETPLTVNVNILDNLKNSLRNL